MPALGGVTHVQLATQKEAVGNSTGREDPDWRCEEVMQFMGLSSGASPKEGQ